MDMRQVLVDRLKAIDMEEQRTINSLHKLAGARKMCQDLLAIVESEEEAKKAETPPAKIASTESTDTPSAEAA